VLDQSSPDVLADAEAVRRCLYSVAEDFGQHVTDTVDLYIEFLIEEFCPDYVAGSP